MAQHWILALAAIVGFVAVGNAHLTLVYSRYFTNLFYGKIFTTDRQGNAKLYKFIYKCVDYVRIGEFETIEINYGHTLLTQCKLMLVHRSQCL